MINFSGRKIINSPLEVGMRSLFIISKIEPDYIDFDRLLIYDYFLVHTNDLSNEFPSIHPPTPHRSGELLIKRQILYDGLSLMYSRGLLNMVIIENGIVFSATKATKYFLNLFSSYYSQKLHELSGLVVRICSDIPTDELRNMVKSNLDKWGGEFINESLVRELKI